MVGASDENEAAEGRSLAPPPSPSPPPPPLIIVPPAASPLQAFTTPHPVLPMAMDGLTLAEIPRRTPPAYLSPTPSPSPSPSSEEEDEPLEQEVGGTAWCEGEAGRRLPAAATPAATNGTSAAKTSTPLQALTAPPPVLPTPMDGLNIPRRTPPASPSPSASEEELDSLERGGAPTALRQAEAELRLPLPLPKPKPKRSIRQAAATSAPANSTCAAKSVAQHILQDIKPGADTGSDVAVDDGDDGLYLMDGQHAKSRAGFRAANESNASDAETGSTRQSTLSIFRQWAAKRAPHLLPYLEPADAGTLLAMEDQEAALALLDWQQGGAVNIQVQGEDKSRAVTSRDDNTRDSRNDQEAIHPRDETTSDIASEDQEKVGSADNVDAVDRRTDIPLDEPDNVTALEDQKETQENEKLLEQDVFQNFKDVVESLQWGAINVDLPTDLIVAQCLSRLSGSQKPIQITITENIDVEVVDVEKISSNFVGKMDIQFPPELDRNVQFMVGKRDELEYTPNPRTDRELFKKIPFLTSERFQEGSFELLKWKKKNGYVPAPLEVSVEVEECPYTKANSKDVTKYFVRIRCLPTGITDLRNIVVTTQVPQVDHLGVARKTRSHICENLGTHVELRNSVEWHIPRLGAFDRSARFDVDAFCYHGWLEPSQFFPIKVHFSCKQSFGSEVKLVVSNVDGHYVDFRQDAVGQYSFIINDRQELVRRAAEAADAQLAWQLTWEEDGDAWVDDMDANEDDFA